MDTYILAGGQSRRFGMNKARVRIDGVPNIVRIAAMLQEVDCFVTVVAQQRDEFSEWSLRTIDDGVENEGPLAGVRSALIDATSRRADIAFILTCDAMNFDSSWIDDLKCAMVTSGSWLSVYASESFMPFPGLYSVSMLPTIESVWAKGNRSLRSLSDACRELGKVSETPLKKDGVAVPRSFNSREDLATLSIEFGYRWDA